MLAVAISPDARGGPSEFGELMGRQHRATFSSGSCAPSCRRNARCAGFFRTMAICSSRGAGDRDALERGIQSRACGTARFAPARCDHPGGGFFRRWPMARNRQLDQSIKVLDLATGTKLLTFRGHENLLARLCFRRIARGSASGSADQTIKVWDIRPPNHN